MPRSTTVVPAVVLGLALCFLSAASVQGQTEITFSTSSSPTQTFFEGEAHSVSVSLTGTPLPSGFPDTVILEVDVPQNVFINLMPLETGDHPGQ